MTTVETKPSASLAESISVRPDPVIRRLKLAVLIAFPSDPARPSGGVEAVAVSLVRGLARRRELDVHVVTQNHAPDQSNETAWEGATIHRLPPPKGPLLVFAVGAGRRRVQEFLRQLQPDVVHAHDTFGIMVKGFPAPRVFTVHGFIHEDTRYAGGRFSWLRSKIWERIETSAWADQPHIVSISPYVRERLRDLPNTAIHDIENPIADECFVVKRNETPGTIFCAAAVCRRKNTLGLVQAFHQLSLQNPEARLRWAGPTTDAAYEKEVRQYIDTHRLGDKVALLDSISASQIRQELARASVFALVSFEEGAPMGIAEAMAAGLPIVTSNRCGMPYMVRDGETGFLVDPNNPNDIAFRLGQVLSDDSLRQQMGRRAFARASELFHPDRVAARTFTVYQQTRTSSRSSAGRRWRILIGPAGLDPTESVSIVNRSFMAGLSEEFDFVPLVADRKYGNTRQRSFNVTNIYYFLKQFCLWVLALIARRPQIVHYAITDGWGMEKGFVFFKLGALFGARRIGHFHSGLFLGFWNALPPWRKSLALKQLRGLSAVILLSETARKEIEANIPIDPARLFVVNNPIDLQFEREAVRMPLARPTCSILYLGGLERAKGVMDLVEAAALAARDSDFELQIVGPEREPNIQADIKVAVANHKLSGRVRIRGGVWGEEKMTLFRNSSIFVLPSYFENFPLVLLEAAAAGLAIIATPVGAAPEFFENGASAVFVKPGDTIALAGAMGELSTSAQKRERLGAAARKMFLKRCSRSAIMEALSNVYLRIGAD